MFRLAFVVILVTFLSPVKGQEVLLEGPRFPIPTDCWDFIYFTGISSKEMGEANVIITPGAGVTWDLVEVKKGNRQAIRFKALKENKYTVSIGINVEHVLWRKDIANAFDGAVASGAPQDLIAMIKQVSTEAAAKLPARGGSCVVEVFKPIHTPPIDPPVDPPVDPPDVTPFEQTIEKLAKETIAGGGSADTALDISNVFSVVSAAVANGELQVPKPAIDAVNAGMKRVFATHTDEAKWAKFRKDLSDSLDFLRQDGSLQTKAQYVAILQEISNGVRKASQSSK